MISTKEICKQLESKGYNLYYVNKIIVGQRLNLQYNEESDVIEIDVLKREYWLKLQREKLEGFEKYEFIFTYSGEKSERPPSVSTLCKMTEKERERVLSLFKK